MSPCPFDPGDPVWYRIRRSVGGDQDVTGHFVKATATRVVVRLDLPFYGTRDVAVLPKHVRARDPEAVRS